MVVTNKIPNLVSALYQEILKKEKCQYRTINFYKTISYDTCVYIFLF